MEFCSFLTGCFVLKDYILIFINLFRNLSYELHISNQVIPFNTPYILYLGGGGGGDPFGAGGPFQGVNVDDIFKQFFGDRAGGFSSPYGFESARQSQVGFHFA